MLKNYSPINCLKHSSKLKTVKIAMSSKAPTIGTIHRVKGRNFTEGMIMGWLTYLNEVLGLNNPMSEDQIEMCAIEIVNEFYALKFSDLTLLFKRIISGSYGEFYERISTPKILTFFREYFEERMTIAEQESVSSHRDKMSDDTFNYSGNVRRIYEGATGYNQSKK